VNWRLEIGDRFAELLAFLHILNRRVQCALGDATGLRRRLWGGVVEGGAAPSSAVPDRR